MFGITEEEANRLWCPLAGSTVDIEKRPLRNCIASKCMMWRVHTGALAPADEAYPPQPERGFCGLAGRPN